MTNDGSDVPAGWYPTPDGQQRYWDGSDWTEHFAPAASTGPSTFTPGGPVAPAGSAIGAMPTSDERTLAMVAHLLGLFATFIGPLIIYAIKKDESPFIRDQAAEALNFSISMAIYFTVYFIVAFILLFVLIGIVLFIAMPFLALGVAILHIIAAVAANKGEYYRYPLTIRFIK